VTDCFILATDGGMVLAERNGGQSEGRLAGWKLAARSLADRKATAVIAREGVILAGTTDGVFRSDDGGQTWEEASDGLRIRHVRWLAYHPDVSDFEVAGTEPAGIFISHDGGTSWQGHPEVEELRDRFKWFLPYSPEAGCVRGFAFHGDRAYAAVEVGGVLRSDDAGATWRLAGGSTGEPVFDIPPSPRVHADVHSVAGHPSSADRVIGATAEGLYRSADAGDTWEASHVGSYCRAVWVDPEDAEHMILGPADSVSRKNGRIEETRDAGATWSRASEGLDLPWPDRMVERFVQVDGNLLAVTSDGRLYEAPLDGLQWRNVLPDLRDIHAVALVR
jgi:photosystem II stability/assembly factor-like uncharacterized protein